MKSTRTTGRQVDRRGRLGSRKSEARRQIQMNSYTTAPVVSVTASNMLITLMLLFRERVDQLYERYSCKCLYVWQLLAERVGFEPTCRLPDKTLSRRPRYDHFGTSPVGKRATHTTVFHWKRVWVTGTRS
jgi:hypothetical protein